MRPMGYILVLIIAAFAAPVFAATAPQTFQIADAGTFANKKAEYEVGARREMDLWQRRMSEADAHAQKDLDHAWVATKEQWALLQQATADSWDRSRAAFERASEHLKGTWEKYHSTSR